MMNYIGYIAAFLTTFSFIPQVFHTIKIKDTSSISLSMYSMFFLGTLGWLIYGIGMDALPIILANGISMSLAGIIFFMKLKNVMTGKDKK